VEMDARKVPVYLAFIWNQSPRNGPSFLPSSNCRTYRGSRQITELDGDPQWRQSALDQSILDRLPSCVGNPDASNLDRQAALLHGLNPYVASPARTRSPIAFTSQPCCVLASTLSTRRWLGRNVWVFRLRDHIAGRADLTATPPFGQLARMETGLARQHRGHLRESCLLPFTR
jgi:hypothetical protein